jgi:predicted phosphoadenosine phosphosulfate sulfurtransferase
MPQITRDHYVERFNDWLLGWHKRGYRNGIPDYAPRELEKKYWAPSWRRMCKVLLRNDWWCKGLGLTQPKSPAYGRYLELKKQGKLLAAARGKASE